MSTGIDVNAPQPVKPTDRSSILVAAMAIVDLFLCTLLPHRDWEGWRAAVPIQFRARHEAGRSGPPRRSRFIHILALLEPRSSIEFRDLGQFLPGNCLDSVTELHAAGSPADDPPARCVGILAQKRPEMTRVCGIGQIGPFDLDWNELVAAGQDPIHFNPVLISSGTRCTSSRSTRGGVAGPAALAIPRISASSAAGARSNRWRTSGRIRLNAKSGFIAWARGVFPVCRGPNSNTDRLRFSASRSADSTERGM